MLTRTTRPQLRVVGGSLEDAWDTALHAFMRDPFGDRAFAALDALATAMQRRGDLTGIPTADRSGVAQCAD